MADELNVDPVALHNGSNDIGVARGRRNDPLRQQ
jgi:hypothetical protein